MASTNLAEISMPEGWLTTREAAKVMGTTKEYLHKKLYLTLHLITPRRFMGRLLWNRADLIAYIETHPRLGTRSQQDAA